MNEDAELRKVTLRVVPNMRGLCCGLSLPLLGLWRFGSEFEVRKKRMLAESSSSNDKAP